MGANAFFNGLANLMALTTAMMVGGGFPIVRRHLVTILRCMAKIDRSLSVQTADRLGCMRDVARRQ